MEVLLLLYISYGLVLIQVLLFYFSFLNFQLSIQFSVPKKKTNECQYPPMVLEGAAKGCIRLARKAW
jgi:hypothetical protein